MKTCQNCTSTSFKYYAVTQYPCEIESNGTLCRTGKDYDADETVTCTECFEPQDLDNIVIDS